MSAGHEHARATGALLRLALDLQIDALLFTVSAEATSGGADGESCSGGLADRAPWDRWLASDVRAVLHLAESVVEERLPLRAVLSGAEDRGTLVLDDLRARYDAILGLLQEAACESSSTGPARTVALLIDHYERRLCELRARHVLRQGR